MRMSSATLKQLTMLDTNNLYLNNLPKASFTQILQSEPLKRLFSQPNIVIKTVPATARFTEGIINNTQIHTKQQDHINVAKNQKKYPEISIVPVKPIADESKETINFLPSKKKGVSEVTLSPVAHEQKLCGHYEACESIVCDVAIQQCIDQDGMQPMLAVNIEDHEINAPVAKHCKNKDCDALSIDHDRCRRALIRLHRCDTSTSACDICGITLKTRKLRMHHRHCTRKDIYRHNENDGAQVLKERMRERELQMIEAAKIKKNDYLDPITGYNRAIETLRKNEELIIIPRAISVPQPVVTVTSMRNVHSNQTSDIKNLLGKVLPNIPIILPQSNIILGKKLNQNETTSIPLKLTALSHNPIVRNVLPPSSTPAAPNQYIQFTGIPSTNVQPIPISNWVMSQAHIVSTPVQPKPFLTPIRVVPITNLMTPSPLLQQSQGIQKFCIIADNAVSPVVQNSNIVPSATTNVRKESSNIQENFVQTVRKCKKIPYKKPLRCKFRKKDFRCSYCPKRFSTEWYFKMHVAVHMGEKLFPCKICDESFYNGYNMKKHMATNHENESISCDICNYLCSSYSSFEKHMKTHSVALSYKCVDCDVSCITRSNLTHHRRKCHGVTKCIYCRNEVACSELADHMIKEHNSVEKAIKNRNRKCKTADSTNIPLSREKLLCNDANFEAYDQHSNVKHQEEQKERQAEHIKTNGTSTKLAMHDEANKCIEWNNITNCTMQSDNEEQSKLVTILCKVCQMDFKNTSELQDHLSVQPANSVKCKCCEHSFHTEFDFSKHSCTNKLLKVCK